jgi:hypothetical protein
MRFSTSLTNVNGWHASILCCNFSVCDNIFIDEVPPDKLPKKFLVSLLKQRGEKTTGKSVQELQQLLKMLIQDEKSDESDNQPASPTVGKKRVPVETPKATKPRSKK